MNKKCQIPVLLALSCLCMADIDRGAPPSSKINGKDNFSQRPWPGASAAAITDVNNLNAQLTLEIDANAALSSWAGDSKYNGIDIIA